MTLTHRVVRRVIAASCLAAAAAAHAHDTWLHLQDQQPGGGLLVLQLGTGGRYPKSEGVIPPSRVVDGGCTDETGARHGLAPRGELPMALEMRSRIGDAKAAGCWLELLPVDLALSNELVETYFHDVRAPQEVRDTWARQLKAGGHWNEVYRKYVRIEAVLPGATVEDLAKARAPRGFPLELVPVGSDPLRVNRPASFQALANGKPVANLPVEFVSLRSPIGVWRQTDAQGRMELALPFPGEWLLRSTAFDLPGADGIWRSRFATLTVQVQ